MDINEAFRRIVTGHLRLIAVFVLVPLLTVVALAGTKSHGYVASARIQASTTSISSDTEADAVLNRVVGVASSTAIVEQALHTVKIGNRSAADAVREVTVSRLGSSTVMDISVTDRDPEFATALASSLATTVVNFIGSQGTPQQQDLVNRLAAEQKQLYDQRVQLVAALSQATGAVTIANLSPLAAVDQQLNDVGSTLRQLQVAIATGSSASLISLADPAKAVPSGAPTEMVLAAIAGLVASLLTASVLEVVRPRVADAQAFARELGVPLLGRLTASATADSRSGNPHPAGLDDAAIIALKRAGARASAQTLVLLDDTKRPRISALADHLTSRLAPARSEKAAQNGHSTGIVPGGSAGSFTHGATTLPRHGVRTLQVETTELSLRVVPMSDLVEAPLTGGCALLVLVRKLTPYSYLRRVADLAQATGWPVAGVLDAPIRARKGRS